MKEFSMTIIKILIGAIIGAGLGILYYYFFGCATNSCPIVSNPVMISLYGAVIGSLITWS